jgi:hypothetical protein
MRPRDNSSPRHSASHSPARSDPKPRQTGVVGFVRLIGLLGLLLLFS